MIRDLSRESCSASTQHIWTGDFTWPLRKEEILGMGFWSAHHATIRNDYPQLVPHKVLGKWLHLSLSHPEFETIALELAAMARKRDPRLGVESQPRKRPTVLENSSRVKTGKKSQ